MRRILVAAVVLTALAVSPAARAWTWPVDGPVLRSFALGDDAYAAGQHRGVDIGAELGAAVRAPTAGTVSFVGSVPGGGRVLTIQTADGYAVTLLQLGTISVARGDEIVEGAAVGAVGPSVDAVTAAPHVHFGVRVAADPNGYLDPLGLLPARPSAAPAAVPEPAPVTAPIPASAGAPLPATAAVQPAPAEPGPVADPTPIPAQPQTADAHAPGAPAVVREQPPASLSRATNGSPVARPSARPIAAKRAPAERVSPRAVARQVLTTKASRSIEVRTTPRAVTKPAKVVTGSASRNVCPAPL